jgi:sugar/nucleoside kinase (ribokinase family)
VNGSFDVIGVGANSVDYVYGLAEFPHPDTSAAKLRIQNASVSYGGQTATTLCTCAAMRLRAKYVGTIGSDDNGERMRRELQQRGIDVEHAYVRSVRNPFAVILLDGRRGERVVLWDRDPALQLRADEIEAALRTGTPRLIHVDDADEDAAIRAASIGRRAGIPVTSDIERVTERTGELVAAVTIPIFAEHVLEPLTGERDFERALRKVGSQLGDACVTLGARGAMLLEGDRLHHVEALPVDVVDTTGAGDVFRGAFITALLRGDAAPEILRFANAAAALSCTRRGAIAAVPTLEETIGLVPYRPR